MKTALKRLITTIACVAVSLTAIFATVGCGDNKGGEATFEDSGVITLEDNGALLTNPDMGWNLSYYMNTITPPPLKQGDYLDNFPCSTVFFRVGWNYIEPEEGKFNWEFTDKIAEEWIKKGKRVAFCWAVTFLGDQSTPLWVKDAGAQGAEYTYVQQEVDGVLDEYVAYERDGVMHTVGEAFALTRFSEDMHNWILNKGDRQDPNYNNGQEVALHDVEKYRSSWVPYYDDPIFLEKWENFLKAAAARYDTPEYADNVEFIEIGSFGDWGEGHASFSHLNPITSSIVKTHIGLYHKYFKNIQIQINDDVVDGKEELITLSKEYGFGVSDHSVQTGDQFNKLGNASVCAFYYSTHPVLLENHNGTTFKEEYYKSVNSCHATYARINVNPYQTMGSEWLDKITLRLGYRLVYTEVKVSEISAGKDVHFEFTMKNAGAAPCYAGGNPTFYIINSLGQVVGKGISEFNVKDLKTGATAEAAKNQTGKAVISLPKDLPGGEYRIAVSVTLNGEDYYNLPLENKIENKQRYSVATFNIDY